MHGQLEVREGEAMGLLQALHWARELQLEDVVFEMDAKTVADSVKSCTEDLTDFGIIIKQCRDILSVEPNYVVEFVRRQANVVAHAFAKAATSYASPYIFESIPTCILSASAII